MSAIVPPTITDRMLAAFRALVRAEDPNRTYRGIYEYKVGGIGSGAVDAAPTDPSLSLPPILRIPMRPGLLAETVTPTIGTTCLVTFVNGDPTRPIVIGLDQTSSVAKVDATATLSLGPGATAVAVAGGGNPVARLGDQVMVFLPPSLPVVGTVSGNPFVGVITVTNPITGSITGGSAKVTSG